MPATLNRRDHLNMLRHSITPSATIRISNVRLHITRRPSLWGYPASQEPVQRWRAWSMGKRAFSFITSRLPRIHVRTRSWHRMDVGNPLAENRFIRTYLRQRMCPGLGLLLCGTRGSSPAARLQTWLYVQYLRPSVRFAARAKTRWRGI